MFPIVRFVPISLLIFFVECQKMPFLHENGETARIVNGTKAKPGQFPFVVSMQMFLNESFHAHSCTLSLITTRTCLGAAHCVLMEEGKVQIPVTILCGIVGNIYQEPNSTCHKFSEVIHHEDYQSNGSLNDIAVFIFKEEMVLDKVLLDTVPLIGPGEVNDGTLITSLGWGNLHFYEEIPSPRTLRYVELKILPRRKCQVDETQICILTRGKGFCAGDSGGPLTTIISGKQIQVGVTSYIRYECANMKSVGVAVEAYTDWIKKHSVGEPTFVSV